MNSCTTDANVRTGGCIQEWMEQNILRGKAETSSVLRLMFFHGFLIHPHTALYADLELINQSQWASYAICDLLAHHLPARWPWSFTEHSIHSLQVFDKGLFTSQSRHLCQESFNSGLPECHSSVGPRPYRASPPCKRNCFAMQCAESCQANSITDG